jgi:hypothetical protein
VITTYSNYNNLSKRNAPLTVALDDFNPLALVESDFIPLSGRKPYSAGA